jgi:hypothetical protein
VVGFLQAASALRFLAATGRSERSVTLTRFSFSTFIVKLEDDELDDDALDAEPETAADDLLAELVGATYSKTDIVNQAMMSA